MHYFTHFTFFSEATFQTNVLLCHVTYQAKSCIHVSLGKHMY